MNPNELTGRKTIQTIALGVFLAASTTTLSFAAPGTSGGDILNFATGARAIGMGEAYTAQADDVSSLYWNPAGLGIMNQSQASFVYNQSYQNMAYQNGSVAVPFEYGALGASLSYMSFGNISGFDTTGNATGNVNAYSDVATLGGAWYGGPLSLGANVKGVQGALSDVKATGFAADFGANYTLQQEVFGGTLRLGTTLRNVGTGLKFIGENDPFPLEWRAGLAAVQMMDKRLNFSVDYGKQRDERGAVYAGFEYWLGNFVALRTGYAGADAAGNGLRAGVGLKLKNLQFDYAYAGYGDLGLSNRFELSMKFGPIVSRLSPEERALYRRAKLAMAQGRYSEAALLLDGLIRLEPNYRAFQKDFRVSLAGVEKQEAAGVKSAEVHFAPPKKAFKDDHSFDDNDLEGLLNLDAADQNVAQKDKPAAQATGVAQ